MTQLRSVIIAFVVLLSVFVVTHVVKFPGSLAYLMDITHGQPILDMSPSFSSAETYQRLGDFGEHGREMYLRTVMVVDIVFPVCAFVFLFLFAKYASAHLGMRQVLSRGLLAFSMLYFILDFLENITIVILLLNFPAHLEFLGANIGYLTVGKRTSMIAAALIPLVLMLFFKISVLLQQRNRSV